MDGVKVAAAGSAQGLTGLRREGFLLSTLVVSGRAHMVEVAGMGDVLYVLLTVALFVLLGLAIRGVERL